MRKTKIICTLGPAVDDYNILKQMILNGLDCARLNFSHGTHEEQKVRIDNVKKAREELGYQIPILLDTKGPEIRIKNFKDKSIILKEGQKFILSSDSKTIGDESTVGLSYPNLAKYVKKGNKILIDDGKIEMEVLELSKEDVVCKVLNGGKVSNHKSINIPNVIVNMEYLSEVDKKDIIFGISQDVDYIAASFIRRKQDIIDLRNFLKENNGESIKIISKIENIEGVNNMQEIIDLSDGVMVARGDLGVEVAFKKLPSIQKDMISHCFRSGKIVITATQMLDSMQSNPRPTRAEVSDVANAVYDRTSCIMLSGESAAGIYPVESVKTMGEIASYAEEDINYEERFKRYNLNLGHNFVSSLCNAAVSSSYQIDAKAIICMTINGVTAEMISSYRPKCPIIAITLNPKVCRQLNLAWNVKPILAERKKSTDELFLYAITKAKETGLVKKGDQVVITLGSIVGSGITDTLKLHVVE
ncbi:MAG: pyruvate kinase [Anaeroplasmataceae bacterium]